MFTERVQAQKVGVLSSLPPGAEDAARAEILHDVDGGPLRDACGKGDLPNGGPRVAGNLNENMGVISKKSPGCQNNYRRGLDKSDSCIIIHVMNLIHRHSCDEIHVVRTMMGTTCKDSHSSALM